MFCDVLVNLLFITTIDKNGLIYIEQVIGTLTIEFEGNEFAKLHTWKYKHVYNRIRLTLKYKLLLAYFNTLFHTIKGFNIICISYGNIFIIDILWPIHLFVLSTQLFNQASAMHLIIVATSVHPAGDNSTTVHIRSNFVSV